MEAKNEIWKPIKDYEGLYEVSNLGRVRRLGRWIERPNPNNPNYIWRYFHKGHIMNQHVFANGYLHVSLHKTGERGSHTNLVHRLVAMAFIPGYKEGLEVNHKDCNKKNNVVENLEWVTRSENLRYADAMEKSHRGKRKRVKQLTLSGELLKIWPSVYSVHLGTGIDLKSISWCCQGRSKTAGGYRWQFADN